MSRSDLWCSAICTTCWPTAARLFIGAVRQLISNSSMLTRFILLATTSFISRIPHTVASTLRPYIGSCHWRGTLHAEIFQTNELTIQVIADIDFGIYGLFGDPRSSNCLITVRIIVGFSETQLTTKLSISSSLFESSLSLRRVTRRSTLRNLLIMLAAVYRLMLNCLQIMSISLCSLWSKLHM